MKNFAGEKQFTGSAILITKELPRKVLLIHHKKHNVWIQPGGHLESIENPIEGAIREVMEETGIDISFFLKEIVKLDDLSSQLPSPDFFLEETIPSHGDNPQHFHIDAIYIIEIDYQKVKEQVEEAYAIGWFEKDEIENLDMYQNTRKMLEKIFSQFAMKE